MKKIGILRFLGTNCDRDVWQAVEDCGYQPEWIWYQDRFQATDFDAFIVPGGFSYGDYLRAGALAAKAPAMKDLVTAAQKAYPILGICNGFQILCEAGLLPGALVRNTHLRFIDKWVELHMKNPCAAWGGELSVQAKLPIAHGEGRYYIEEQELKSLYDNNQVWWTYGDNPNGSVDDIAGVMNTKGNVAGLMPHPERALHGWMGGEDGKCFFQTI